jgi:hypothetical protein
MIEYYRPDSYFFFAWFAPFCFRIVSHTICILAAGELDIGPNTPLDRLQITIWGRLASEADLSLAAARMNPQSTIYDQPNTR